MSFSATTESAVCTASKNANASACCSSRSPQAIYRYSNAFHTRFLAAATTLALAFGLLFNPKLTTIAKVLYECVFVWCV